MDRAYRRVTRQTQTRAASAIALTLAVAATVGACDGQDQSGGGREARTTSTTVHPGADSATTGNPAGPSSAAVPSINPGFSASVPASAGGVTLPPGDDTSVSRITDGDTIVVDGKTRVRLIGIDTPETRDPRKAVQCFGPEASRQTGTLLPAGTPVRLVYDVERTDRYGRALAYVFRLSDGLFVNLALVRDGFAAIATYPPNVAHVEEFRAAEREARAAGRGLWGGCPASRPTPATGAGRASPDTVRPAAGRATSRIRTSASRPADVQ